MGAAGAWEAIGFFVLRTPLLPFEELESWTGTAAAEADRRWRALAIRADVREALFLASPTLEAQLEPWLATDGQSASPERVRRPLAAYLTRMASRATPFGLFAGCGAGHVGATTALVVSDDIHRQTRPDMDYLVALASRLEGDPDIRAALTWRPNSSLYQAAGRLRLVETRIDGSVRSHHLVALVPDPPLRATLDRAAGGARLRELAQPLAGDEVTVEEAAAYLDDLVDAQVLESNLSPPVTGPEPLGVLIDALRRVGPAAPVTATLQHCAQTLAAIDKAGTGNDPGAYRRLRTELLGYVPDADPAHLFQVDMFRSGAGVSLGPRVVAEAARSVELLQRLSEPEPDHLAAFREAFEVRYEDREVALVEALDEETGIGFNPSTHPAAEGSPLLAELELGPSPETRPAPTSRDDHLWRLVDAAVRDRSLEIELDGAAIEALSHPAQPNAPPTVALLGRLAARSCEAVDRGEFSLLVHSVQANSGAQLLGRFCHGDSAIADGVRRILAVEETSQPDAAFAEIVHLPEGRMGNILCRPVLRKHEIVFLGRSCGPANRQLPITDLWVSVRRGRVVLRSARLGRQVIPRLTSAHNTALRSLGMYRFLAALQGQSHWSGLSWSWGALARSPFCPRIRAGRLVLVRATWVLDREQIAALVAGSVAGWRERFGVPRWIALADGDNELVVDLEGEASVALFTQTLRGRREARVVELFPPPDQLCAAGPGGRYLHEFVLPLRRTRQKGSSPRLPPPAAIGARARRRFPPGSEWLYIKLYTGTATADDVLCAAVAPLVRAAVESGAADRWFFLRYGDPEHHLRVRLHGDPARLRGEVEPLIDLHMAEALGDGRLWRVGYDTYEQELERYGGPAGMELCEAIFHADSDACLAIIERLEGDEGLDARWRLALAGTDRLLADFGFELDIRRRFVRDRRASYLTEFPGGAALEKQLSRRGRALGPSLDPLLDGRDRPEHPLAPGLELLAARSSVIGPLADQLRAQADQLTVSIEELVASVAHLHAIRLLRSGARAQELVIHDLLDRAYTRRLAREGDT